MELHLLLPGTVLGCIRDIVLITIPKVPCACLDRITRDLVSFPVAENWAPGPRSVIGQAPDGGSLGALMVDPLVEKDRINGSDGNPFQEGQYPENLLIFKTSKHLLCQARGLQPMLEEIPSPWSLGCVEAIVGEETILFFMFNKIWYDDPE